MTSKNIKKTLLLLVLTLFFAGTADAKLKYLPAIKTYKDFYFKKNTVESVKTTVYAAVQNGTEVKKGDIADFILETFFDIKGNRTKEVVYHPGSGKVEATTVWTYDEKGGTVQEIRTNDAGAFQYRIEYIINYKLGTVLARRFENVQETETIVRENVLVNEEVWTEKKKTVSRKQTLFSVHDGEAARQLIQEFDLAKPYTLYTMMEENCAPIDCPWYTDFNSNYLKTTSGKSKKEQIFTGDKVEYSAKSNLLTKIRTLDKNKVLKNEVIYTYTFDQHKNWAQLIQNEDAKPKYLVERTIKYRS